MNIHTATIYAKQGCSIKRTSWVSSHYLTIKQGKVECHNNDTAVYWNYQFTVDDVSSDDWELFASK